MFPTYEKQMQLVKEKKAIAKVQGDLTLFKYHRNVMYDYLWETDDALMECRGHVYNNVTGKLVVAAPRKSFNYLENGWWSKKPLTTWVRIEKKYNGFLACATLMPDNSLLVTTTGSFSGEYQETAQKMIEAVRYEYKWFPDETKHFEICAEFDPHIVYEEPGVYLLASRGIGGYVIPQSTPNHATELYLSDAIEMVKTFKGEGFMVYDCDTDRSYTKPCKMKSPYYVGKKKLMRMNRVQIEKMYKHGPEAIDMLPPSWYSIVHQLKKDFDPGRWECISEQDRRLYLEGIYKD